MIPGVKLLLHVVVLIVALESVCLGSAQRVVTFKANKIVSRPLPTVERQSTSFTDWFARAQTPNVILASNPGLSSFRKLSSGMYRADTAPLRFPGLNVKSSFDIRVEFDGKEFGAYCDEGAVKQEYEGNKFLARIVSKLIPSVVSANICRVNEAAGVLSNHATLSVSFEVPSWFPFSDEAMERNGSETIGRSMEEDTTRLLGAIVDAYLKEQDDTDTLLSESDATTTSQIAATITTTD